MPAQPAVAMTADDAAFLAAALKLLRMHLDRAGTPPVRRVHDLERQLASAATYSDAGTSEREGGADGGWWPVIDTIGVTEAATQLGTSRENVRALCRRGTLPAHRVGRTWQIPTAAITNRIQNRKDTTCHT